MNFEELRSLARLAANPRPLSRFASAGGVGAALLAASGSVYTGVCIDTACSMGFCAEHAAASAMITHGQSQVVQMIAVTPDDQILPPCGRCREFVSQLHENNGETEVMVAEGRVVTLAELLPWRE